MSRSLFIKLGFDLKAFSTSSENISRSLKKTGKQMQSIGKSMSMSITAPIVAMGGLAVKVFADFEQSMAKVQAVSGATGKEFDNLTKLAKDLGISTRFTSSEVADLQLNFAKLGFSSSEIQKVTAATLDLALATGEDLASSAAIAGGTLRGFALEADQLGRVTDVMAKSFSSSALDLEKFSVGMPKVAALAEALGMSIETTTAQLSVLANSNIDASTSGTMLRNMFLAAKEDGFDFEEAIKEISESSDKAATSMKFFDVRATAVALTLAKNISKVDELTKSYENSGGAAAAMAAIMDDTLEGSLFKLKSAAEGLAISFGEMLAPVVSRMSDFMAELAIRFSELDPETKKTVVMVAALVAAIGPLLVVIGSLTVAMGFLAANPVVLMLTALVAGVVLAVAAYRGFQSMLENSRPVFDGVKTAVNLMSKAYDNLSVEVENISRLKGLGIKASKEEIKLSLLNTRALVAETNEFIKNNLERKKQLIEKKKAAMAIVMSSLQAPGRQGEFVDVELARVKTIQKNIDLLADEIAKLQEKGGQAVDGIIDLEKQLSSIDNVDIKVDLKTNTVDSKIEVPVKPIVDTTSLKGLGDLLSSMFEKKAFDPNIRIDLSNVKIETSTLPDIVTEAEEIGIEISDALTNGLQKMVTQSAALMGEFVGNMITGSDKIARQDFGKAFLGMIGSFMQEFGTAMIGIGVAQAGIQASIASMNPALAIVGGIALVAAGSALSNVSKAGIGGDPAPAPAAPAPDYSGGGNMGGDSYTMHTQISGRDIQIVTQREKAFRR